MNILGTTHRDAANLQQSRSHLRTFGDGAVVRTEALQWTGTHHRFSVLNRAFAVLHANAFSVESVTELNRLLFIQLGTVLVISVPGRFVTAQGGFTICGRFRHLRVSPSRSFFSRCLEILSTLLECSSFNAPSSSRLRRDLYLVALAD